MPKENQIIRILHVIGKMDCGGAETIIMNLYRRIDRTRFQFDFVVHSFEEGFFDQEIKSLGGRIYHVQKWNGRNSFSYINYWKNFWREHPEYDIIHGHIASPAFIYMKMAKCAGIIVVAHSHNTNYYRWTINSFAHRVLSFPIRMIANQFLACSAQAGIDRFGKKIVSSNRFHILYNGIDSERFAFNAEIRDAVRKKNHVSDDTIVVGHVGRFESQKNHVFLVELFYKITKENSNVALWLFGKGKEEEKIHKLVEERNLTNFVTFWGVSDEIHSFMQAMDIFVLPSYNEGFGIAAVEAQAAGLPCITSDYVPQEADLGIGLMKRLPLQNGMDMWMEEILKTKRERINTRQILEERGYDIETSTKWMEIFYTDIMSER